MNYHAISSFLILLIFERETLRRDKVQFHAEVIRQRIDYPVLGNRRETLGRIITCDDVSSVTSFSRSKAEYEDKE
jgi:hypothetical protein